MHSRELLFATMRRDVRREGRGVYLTMANVQKIAEHDKIFVQREKNMTRSVQAATMNPDWYDSIACRRPSDAVSIHSTQNIRLFRVYIKIANTINVEFG